MPDIPPYEYLQQPIQIVTRTESTVGRSPAAVYVLDGETIRRMGVRTIPDALRAVPGLNVASINSNIWNVSSRGFSSRFARKLLVQIDGRTVYTPLTSGVFWDVNDVLLEDIERIEVIRGPGATVWGANAVNGVINIITKNAKDTKGVFVESGGGTYQEGFSSARVGGETAQGINYRVWGKWFERDSFYNPRGFKFDDWRQGRVGFRADWEPETEDAYTLQGDLYTGTNGIANDQPVRGLEVADEPVSGGYMLSRWTHDFGESGETQLQIYYNNWHRETIGFNQNLDTFDVDFQHQFDLNDRNEVVWGLGYRQVWDRLPNDEPQPVIATDPARRTYSVFSGFVQDWMALRPDELYLMAGTKLLENTFTGFEVQPNARLLWLPNQRTAVWTSVSRAIRIPSRIAEDGRVVVAETPLGGPVTIFGSNALESEEMIAYEAGIRQQPAEYFSWDLAFFYNVDERLVGFRPTGVPGQLQFFNAAQADSYGFEFSNKLDLTENWKLTSWYSLQRTVGENSPESVVPSSDVEGGVPRHQAFLMSSWNLGCDWELDVITRYMDNLTSLDVPHYISMDIRVAWQATEHLQLTVVGQNLLDTHHPEYGSSIFVRELATEVPRSVYAMATMRY